MSVSSKILILVAIKNQKSLKHFSGLLADPKSLAEQLLSSPAVPFDSISVEETAVEEIHGRIKRHRRRSKSSGVILISDGLLDQLSYKIPSSGAARELLDDFGDSLLAIIAVKNQPMRIPEIERSISLLPEQAELYASLDRCIQKLAYLRKPHQILKRDPEKYVFHVLDFEHQLIEYFRFRYNAYSVMCYLDADAERAPSCLEIDWFDKCSLHVGVYYHDNGFEELVGTGRLIITEEIPGTKSEQVSLIAKRDSVLRQLIDEAVGLHLPVLQSHAELMELMNLILDQHLVVGEISRVIVAPEHRGMGLSCKITDYLVNQAKEAGVSDLLLECLPIHSHIYQKCGFSVIPHNAEQVYRIGRTMDVMALSIGEYSIFSTLGVEP